MVQNNQLQEDEIDLRELFLTIWDHKKFIVIFTLIFTIGAVIYAYTKTPIYEATALIELGKYKNTTQSNDYVFVDNAKRLAKKLNVLFIDKNKNDKNKKAEISSIIVPSTDYLQIKSNAISNTLAKKKIKEVLEYVQKEHKKILDDAKLNKEIKIKNIDMEINNTKNREIPLLNKKIDFEEKLLISYKEQIKSIDINLKRIEQIQPSLSALQLIEKQNLMRLLNEKSSNLMNLIEKKEEKFKIKIMKLKENRMLISSLLSPHNYKNTELIGEILTNDYPIKPKKKLIVAVAFVTGLILSVFLVFLIEFIKGIRKEEKIK